MRVDAIHDIVRGLVAANQQVVDLEAQDEPVLAVEVSSVNDDAADNEFLGGSPRYPEIEEDVPARHLLVAEYAALLG